MFSAESIKSMIIASVNSQMAHFRSLPLPSQIWLVVWNSSVATFVLGAMYFIGLYIQQCIELRNFKGPLALPLVGNCYAKEALFLVRYLASMRKKFGKVYTFFAFAKPYLVVCEPKLVRDILSDTKVFIKGIDYTNQFAVAFGEGLVTSNGEKHKKDRSHFYKYFIKTNISNYIGMVNAKCEAAIEEMLLNQDNQICSPKKGQTKKAGKGAADENKVESPADNNIDGPRGKVYDMEHFFALLALRVFMQFAINFNFGLEKEEWLAKSVSDGSWAIGRMITLGLPMWNIFPAVQTVRKGREILWTEMKKVVDERRRSMEAGTAGDLDDCLTEIINSNMPEQEINDHLVTLLSAGHDTTACFSGYMCYLLAINPDHQDRLRKEILGIMGDRTEVTCDDIAQMKYLTLVMLETLRLYSIIPCVSRGCTQETYNKETGITIPKGANILIPMTIINRDPDIWEEPSKFIPERFEGATGLHAVKDKGFFPFGYGQRTCIGNQLSQMEAATFMIKLLTKFNFIAHETYKPKIFAGISLTTSNGIVVRLQRRPSAAAAAATPAAASSGNLGGAE